MITESTNFCENVAISNAIMPETCTGHSMPGVNISHTQKAEKMRTNTAMLLTAYYYSTIRSSALEVEQALNRCE